RSSRGPPALGSVGNRPFIAVRSGPTMKIASSAELSMTTSPREENSVKHLRVSVTVRFAKRRATRPHVGLHLREVRELALVACNRFELDFHRSRDVHGQIVILLRPFDDVNLAPPVRLAVRKQLGEGHVTAGRGVDTVEEPPACDAVIPVR